MSNKTKILCAGALCSGILFSTVTIQASSNLLEQPMLTMDTYSITTSSCAFLNLLCTAITILLGYALVFHKHEIADIDEDDVKAIGYKNRILSSCIVVALVSILAFLLTENIYLPMVLVDQWTIFMVAFPLTQIILLLCSMKYHTRKNSNVTKSQY